MADTNEQTARYVAALVEELRGAKLKVAAHEADDKADPDDKQALVDRVNDVNVELSKYISEAKAPAKRAEQRPASKAQTR
jgi:hypothetical protein